MFAVHAADLLLIAILPFGTCQSGSCLTNRRMTPSLLAGERACYFVALTDDLCASGPQTLLLFDNNGLAMTGPPDLPQPLLCRLRQEPSGVCCQSRIVDFRYVTVSLHWPLIVRITFCRRRGRSSRYLSFIILL